MAIACRQVFFCLFFLKEEISLLIPFEFLAPVSSSGQRKSLFPLDKEMSSEWKDPKEGKVFLASDLWSHSQSGLSGLYCRSEAPDCAWSIEGRGYLKSRGGRQDRVGGDKLLIVDGGIHIL